MDEPYTVGDFSPENYDKKFRGKVRFWIVHFQFTTLYFYVPLITWGESTDHFMLIYTTLYID
jgi:hypothetical protein